MTDEEIADLNRKAIVQQDAEDPEIFAKVLDLRLRRRTSIQRVHERLIEEEGFEDVSEEAVRRIMGSGEFLRAFAIASADPVKYCRKKIAEKLPWTVGEILEIAGPGNEDKRSRTTNLHWLAGVGTLSPTQKIEVGEDLIGLSQRIFGGAGAKEGDATPE